MMLAEKAAESLLDDCLLGRQPSGSHRFDEKVVIDVDVRPHDPAYV